VSDARQRGYDGPLARLLALDGLPEGSILAHGVHLTEAEVRTCGERGLWLVQNPRSNKGNGVGYPNALVHSSLVALGTDGYPADMRAEREALLAEAREHGDRPVKVAPRLEAGHALLAERFGPAADATAEAVTGKVIMAGRSVVRDGILQTGDMDEIRARAREQADLLWKRMVAL
jgi:cytosine/adenosine deaminase-related metal-dependent hydrolase